MKRTLFSSYLDGVRLNAAGESYRGIMKYFIPEFLTALVLYSLVALIDASYVASLKSTADYAMLSLTTTLFHFITKIAEGLSVGTMVLCGFYHGKQDVTGMVRAISAACIITTVVAFCISGGLYLGARHLYAFLGTPAELIEIGVPFLRLRAIGAFLMFMFFMVSGFLRGITRNDVTMRCYIVGSVVFLILDYLLIFGAYGFPQYGLQGSAIASIVQYSVMLCIALAYIRKSAILASYSNVFSVSIRSCADAMRSLCNISWPVMGDKAIFAITRILLASYIAPMGKSALGAFGVIRDIEMFAFVPAIACAQVSTFLVSNYMGAGDPEGARCTVKKILLVACFLVGVLLCVCSYYAYHIVHWFDSQGSFTEDAVVAYRLLCMLSMLDIVQVILSSALRGAAQVRVVLGVRLCTLLFFSIPVLYATAHVAFQSNFVRFMTLYGAFYIANGLMALWYVYWFRTGRWQQAHV